MFERFTDGARRVVVFAQEESRLLNHDYIGTEHLLLGLLAEEDGMAARSLRELGVTHREARGMVKEMVGMGESPSVGHIPFSEDAKEALELGLREAIGLGHDHIGTEHILLGLLGMPDGVASRALRSMGVDPEQARRKAAEMFADSGGRMVMELPRPRLEQRPPGRPISGRQDDPALVPVVFVLVALVAVQVAPPAAEIARWGLSLLLGGVLLWAGGFVIGTGTATPRARGAGRYLRVLGGLTLAAAASVFVLGALLG